MLKTKFLRFSESTGDLIVQGNSGSASSSNNVLRLIGQGPISAVANGNTVTFTSTADVAGPASSTDNQFALFSGTSGKTLKASSIVRFTLDSIFAGQNAGNGTQTGLHNTSYGAGTLNALTDGEGNSVFGKDVLKLATTANYCTGGGYLALSSAISGDSAVALGESALLSATNPVRLVALGARSMYSMDGGLRDTGLGFESLYNATTANDCFAGGYQSQFSNLTSVRNVSLGNYSLYNCIEDDNVALGHEAGFALTLGSNNLIAGSFALRNAVNASNVVALGGNCLKECVSGSSCTGAGVDALTLNEANNNSAFGYKAGSSNVTGLRLTAGGFQAALSSNANDITAWGFEALKLATGPGNTAVGALAGDSFANISNCTFLGAGADAGVDNLENATAIGAGAIVSKDNALILGNNADVGIGTSEPSLGARLDIRGGDIHHKGIAAGFAGSYHKMLQKGAQTTGTSTAILASHTVGAGQMVMIDGVIGGFQSDKTDSVAATFFAAAYRDDTGSVQLIGNPDVTGVASAGGMNAIISIDVDAGGNTLRVRVTGIAGQTWNWFARYSFSPLETNA